MTSHSLSLQCCRLVAVLVVVLCVEGLAHAEMYAGGQLGFALPGDLKSDNSGNVELANSFAYGLKFGNFFEDRDWSWLGFELEAFNTTPHIKQQTLPGTTGSGPLSGEIAGKNFGVTTFAVNAIARLPYSTTFEPYAGIGIGMNWMRVSEGGFSAEAALSPSLNILAGVRSYVSESLALFGEFKYNFVDVDFDKNPLGGTYHTKMFMFGISYHFDPHEFMRQ